MPKLRNTGARQPTVRQPLVRQPTAPSAHKPANGDAIGNGHAADSKPAARVETRPSMQEALKHALGAIARSSVKPHAPVNPFAVSPDLFPPHVRPARLAMDDAGAPAPIELSNPAIAWAGSVYTQAFAEGITFMGYTYLSELTQRPEYRVISETLATEMTRKWITLQATGDEDKSAKIRDLNAYLTDLEVQDRFHKLAEGDGFFGRIHLYIDTGQGDDVDELKLPIGNGRDKMSHAKIGKGDLKALRVIEPVWCYPANYNSNDPLSPAWYNPQAWIAMSKEIHVTRLLRLVGREVPDMLKPAYAFGGLSLSQMAKPYVDNWLRTRQSVADLLHSFTVFVLSSDLQTLLMDDGLELFRRIELFNNLRDNRGLFLTNKDSEEFQNISVPLGTLDALQAQTQEHMAAVSRIPLVKLLGIQPAGLNASSEGELRAFYDTVHAFQAKFFTPALKRVVGFAQLSLWGEVDPEIGFVYEPLWALDEKGEAEVRKIDADTGKILIDGGVLDPREERARIAADATSPYQGLDINDVPEPPEQPGVGDPDDPESDKDTGENARSDDNGGQGKGAAEDGASPFVFDAGWTEADHPRGQPGNAGQFGASGGGVAGKKADEPKTVSKAGPGKGGGFTNAFFKDHPTMKAQAEHLAKQSPEHLSKALSLIEQHKLTDPGAQHIKKMIEQSLADRQQTGITSQAPLDPSKLRRVGKQMGSNPGGVYEGPDGQRYYVKQGKSKEHVRNELAAVALYNLAGAPTLKYRPVQGGDYIASEMSTLDKDNAANLSPAQRKQAQADFAVHAWLANWDAAGLTGDNIGTVAGKPVSLDLGGALSFRAQGAPKGSAFGNSVSELDTLRDAKMNHASAQMFADMSAADVRDAAAKVTQISDDAIRQTVRMSGEPEALATKLIARKRDIAKRVGQTAADEAANLEEQLFLAEMERDAAGKGEADGYFRAAEMGLDDFTPDDHPHAPAGSAKGGQFVAKGGAGSSGEAETPQFKTKKAMVQHMLQQGTTVPELIKATGWKMFSMSHAGKHYNMTITKTPEGKYKGTINEKGGQPVEIKLGGELPGGLKVEQAAAAAKQAEQQQQQAGETSALAQVKKFSPKFAAAALKIDENTALSPLDAGKEKVKAAVQSGDATVAAVEVMLSDAEATALEKQYGSIAATYSKAQAYHKTKQNQQQAAAAQQALMAEVVQVNAEKVKAQAAEQDKVLGELSKEHGEAFKGFVATVGDQDQALSLMKQAKKVVGHAKLPISEFEAALIISYTGSAYDEINPKLRKGSWTAAQHDMVRTMNKALRKLPAYEGMTKRGAHLTADLQALYVAGNVVEERAFTSTSKGGGFGGNTIFSIAGKSGRDVSPISQHKSESEVLFPARSFFRVDSVTGKPGGQMHVHMTEVEAH